MKNWLIVQASKLKKLAGEKVLVLTLTKLNQLLNESLVEKMGPKEGLKIAFEGGLSLGHEFMMELAAHLEKDINRVPAYVEAAWILFSGHSPTTQEFRKLEIDGVEIHESKFTDKDCPWCRDISFPHKFCQFPAGAFQGAAQTWSALTRNGEYNLICRETKCSAVGDEFCEWTMIFIPKGTSLSFIREHFPELFEDVDTGFVEY